METGIQDFINKKKDLQKNILDYIEHGQTINLEDQLIKMLDDPIFGQNKSEIKSLIYLISAIAKNHHRNQFFFDKLEQILLKLKENVMNNLSNDEIYNIFKSNKRILLFLIKEKYIEINQSISDRIKNDQKLKEQFQFYFYPEMKEFIDEETQEGIKKIVHEIKNNDFDSFEKKRKLGENDDKICQIIQNDSTEEFVQFVTRQKLSLKETIKPSIFETNPLLIKNKPSLIEYSAFYGSLNIFNYLISKEIELTPSLWIYSIHSQKEELIQLLQNKNIQFPNNNIQNCIDESIKCHHIEFVNFFLNIKKNENDESDSFSKSVKYLNYSFFPNDLNNITSFYYLCQNDILNLVELLLKNEDLVGEINTKIILKIKCFFLINKVLLVVLFEMMLVIKSLNGISTLTFGQIKFLICFFKCNYNINFFFNEKTPLSIAVEKENIEIIQLLLDLPKIDINTKSISNRFLSLIKF